MWLLHKATQRRDRKLRSSYYLLREATYMTNPFDNEKGEFLVLVNHEGQYSLWPTFRQIPEGWTAVGPRGNKKDCLDWVEANWTDMRPKSLIEAMNKKS